MEIDTINFLKEGIKIGSAVSLSGCFICWFTGHCLSKIIIVFKSVSS